MTLLFAHPSDPIQGPDRPWPNPSTPPQMAEPWPRPEPSNPTPYPPPRPQVALSVAVVAVAASAFVLIPYLFDVRVMAAVFLAASISAASDSQKSRVQRRDLTPALGAGETAPARRNPVRRVGVLAPYFPRE